MTSSISGMPAQGASDASSAAAAALSAATGKTDASKELGDKDTFLKLLVAQLKYQDPSNPADSTQFLAQTAQFTQVEKLGDIADLLKTQRLVGVSSLVGHQVSYMDDNGAKLTGTISSAKLNGDSEPLLRIGNTDVQLSKVMEVLPIAGTPGAAATTGTPGATGAAATAGLAANAAAAASTGAAAKPATLESKDDEEAAPAPTTGPKTA